jgi:hypothetical protein
MFYSHNLHFHSKRVVISRQQSLQLINPRNRPNYPSVGNYHQVKNHWYRLITMTDEYMGMCKDEEVTALK